MSGSTPAASTNNLFIINNIYMDFVAGLYLPYLLISHSESVSVLVRNLSLIRRLPKTSQQCRSAIHPSILVRLRSECSVFFAPCSQNLLDFGGNLKTRIGAVHAAGQ